VAGQVAATEEVHSFQKLPSKLPARPSWMDDLISFPADQLSAHRSVYMAGVPSVVDASSPYNYTVLNNVSYNGDFSIFPGVNRVEEWLLSAHPPGCKVREADPDQCDLDIYGNGSSVALDIGSSHVFHMHTEHFQVVRTDPPDAPGLDFKVGEWHDTLLFGHNSPDVYIRVNLANYTGDVWYHCHYMKHAVQGMIARANVV